MSDSNDLPQRVLREIFRWTVPSLNGAALQKIMANVQNSTGEESFRKRLHQAVQCAAEIEYDRGLRGKNTTEPFLSNPLLIAERLADYRATETEYLAAILYSSVLPFTDEKTGKKIDYDPQYIEKIRKEFGDATADLTLQTLQFYETNLLLRPPILEYAEIFSQSEEERLGNFGHMLEEVLSENRVLLENMSVLRIRGAEWVEGLNALLIRKGGAPLEENEDIQFIRPAIYINMPVLARAHEKAQFAGHGAIATSLMNIHNDLGFLSLQLTEPLRYKNFEDMIEERKNKLLRTIDVAKSTTSERGRRVLIGKILEDEINASLHPELQRQCKIVVRPGKSVFSLRRKFMQKSRLGVPMEAVDTSDIIALTVIVKHPTQDVYRTLEQIQSDDYIVPREISQKLARAKTEECPLLHQVHACLSKDFELIDERTKNFITDPLQCDKVTEEPTRKDNGYQAIHVTIKYHGIPVEIKIQGHAMQYDALFGSASHDAYKHQTYFGSEGVYPVTAKRTVSIWGPDNNIYRLPRGATVADFLASLGTEVAFSTVRFALHRNAVFGDIENPKSFATPLASNDKISFSGSAFAVDSSEHRRMVIDACTLAESRTKLNAAHAQLEPTAPVGGTQTPAQTKPRFG